MQIDFFRPENPGLQNYIEGYYILNHSEDEGNVKYLTFPSIYSIVSVVSHAENTVLPEIVSVKSSQFKSLDTSLVCRFNKPICFEYSGNIKEITIAFKPLGLNIFLKKELKDYSKGGFDAFVPFLDYEREMETIIAIKDQKLLVKCLEKYWVDKVNGFRHPFLHEAISLIEEKPNISTIALANQFDVSQKTLIKHFKHHICKTPSEYKRIFRFRKALETMRTGKNEVTNLTDLSYISDFFDQSHMITNFKSLTGLPPKSFFKNLTTVIDSKIHWLFY